MRALRELPDSARGWQADKVSVQCQSCKAISVFDAANILQRCEFCGSTALVPGRAGEGVDSPLVAPADAHLRAAGARPDSRAGTASSGWPRTTSRKKATTDTTRGIYLPGPDVRRAGARAWSAERGDYYYTGSGKNRQRHTRWTSVHGEFDQFFDDDLVCASMGVHQDLLRKVEPFPTTDSLVPYDAGDPSVGRGALRDRPRHVGAALARADGLEEHPQAVRRTDLAATRTATSRCSPPTRTDVQTHPRACLARRPNVDPQ